jgi:hypothetical protein
MPVFSGATKSVDRATWPNTTGDHPTMQTRKELLLAALATVLLSGVVARAPAAPPSAPWTVRSIGNWEAPGFADVDTRGLWTLRAFNGDVLQSVDSALFVGQPLSGDGSVVALILAQEGGDVEFARAGVMFRENDGDGARNVFLSMTTGHGLALTFRPSSNLPSVDTGADGRYGPRQFPTWIRLQREGNTVTPFLSDDGFGWTQLHAPIVLPGLATDGLAGLAASSLFSGPMTAVFVNPTVAPGQLSPCVQACVGSRTVLLTWPPVSGAVGYLVRRSAPGTPGLVADLLTAKPIKETSFLDGNLTNGKAVRYLISPLFDHGGQLDEGWATTVTTTPAATPANLVGCDIDVQIPRLSGAISYDPSTETYTVTGSGSDIWDTSDHCFFASQLVKGNVQITAKILDRPSGKAGVMLRESLDGPARMVLLAGTASNGVVYQYRGKTGGAAGWSGKPAITDRNFAGALFLRLVRNGATITPFVSTDGKTFTQAGLPRTFDPPLAESLYVGYAVTSQDAGTLGSSTVSDLAIASLPG